MYFSPMYLMMLSPNFLVLVFDFNVVVVLNVDSNVDVIPNVDVLPNFVCSVTVVIRFFVDK